MISASRSAFPCNFASDVLHEHPRAVLSFTDGVRSSGRLSELASGRSLSVDALAARVLAWAPTEPDETPYVGVHCHRVDVPTPPGHVPPTDAADAPRVLRRAMIAAIERSVRDARCVGVMTGGGLDSAGLLALVGEWARPRGIAVFAVALDFAGRGDDRPYLRMVEDHLRCEVIRVPPEAAGHRLTLTDGVDAAPLGWPMAAADIELMVQARKRGADCVLTGAGGDDLFDGEPTALAERARRGEWVSAFRSARRLRGFGRPRGRVLPWVVRPLMSRLVPAAIRMLRARRTRPGMIDWAGPRLRSYLDRTHERDLTELAEVLPQGTLATPGHRERMTLGVAWTRHQMQVASGVERADPFFDTELLATVTSFPPDWLLRGDVRRGLFRAALRDRLPAPLLEREDKADFEPALVRMTNAAGGLETLRDLASMEELVSFGLVDEARFRVAFDAFVARPEDGLAWADLWPPLCVERFLRCARASRSS